MNDTSQLQGASTEQRPIPRPPGGGSWTFDETTWSWKSNDPQPEEAAEPEQAPQTDVVDEPVQAGSDFQQPKDSQE